MAGGVFLPDGDYWGTSSSVFYWAVDVMAEHASSRALGARLEEISRENLGFIDVEAVSDVEREDLVSLIRRLPEIAREELPQSDGRRAIIAQMEELASNFPDGMVRVGGSESGAAD